MTSWYQIDYVNGYCPAVAGTRGFEATMIESITPLAGRPDEDIKDAFKVMDFSKCKELNEEPLGIHYYYEANGKCQCKEQCALTFVFPKDWNVNTDEVQVMYAEFAEPIDSLILEKVGDEIVILDTL